MKKTALTILALINYTTTLIRSTITRDGAKRYKMWAKCERNMKASLARM
jgi:hypothetical protein